jgi:hypothetical protein
LLECQNDAGWFVKRNIRGHGKEHATAYALGALELLGLPDNRDYLELATPLTGADELLLDAKRFRKWISRLGLKIDFKDPVGGAGWNYVWRNSHIVGGVAAAVGMRRGDFERRLGAEAVEEFFARLFAWLDREVNPKTGLWQRAVWNWFYKKPTIIDMGGAAHFYWVYYRAERPFPAPAALIRSTASIQRETGLYRDEPMCIDFDANFHIVRAFLQLPEAERAELRETATRALERNAEGIARAFAERPLREIYRDSHGLPGALAALIECAKMPNLRVSQEIRRWRNPLDATWWL